MTCDITETEIAYIEKHGKIYTSAALPADVSFGRLGWCFDECFIRALLSKGKYRYVEGVATDPETYSYVLHAWLTDGEHAFDPTWGHWDNKNKRRVRMPISSAYVGIEMPIEDVLTFMSETGMQGVIANRQLLPGLATKLIGGAI